MRRNAGYELLLLAVAAVLLAGCSQSSSPEVADSTDRAVDIVIPDLAEAEPLGATGEAATTTQAARSGTDPEIAEGADSDTPGAYKPPATDNANHEPHAHSPSSEGVDEKAPKRNGRRPDGDDPDAPLVVAKAVEEKQDDTPLNNGREPSAKPLPEGQRVAVEQNDVDGDSLNSGRAPGAKPGDALPDSAPVKATSKPAAPTRKTLADISESVQALDKNSDGQLGLSEWPRDKLAEFKTLDADNDGFLTPAELIAGQKKKKSAADGQEKPAKTTDKADATEKATATTGAESAKSDDSKDSSTETDDAKEATSDTSADQAASEDDSKADDEAEAGTP